MIYVFLKNQSIIKTKCIMNLVINEEHIKVSNFVDYLIENYRKEGETYHAELVVQDKYDRKLIEKRIKSLDNNLLVFMNDEFEIIDKETFEDFDKFIVKTGDLFAADLNDKVKKEDYKNLFVHYDLKVTDGNETGNFSFYYLNLNN